MRSSRTPALVLLVATLAIAPKFHTAPDGKSGVITFPEEAADDDWVPQYQIGRTKLNHAISEEPVVLVFFYSAEKEEIGRSRHLGEEFEKAAKELVEGDHEIPCYLFDATDEINKGGQKAKAALESEFGVTDLPAYRIFRNGRPAAYEGQTDTKSLVSFMNVLGGLPSRQLKGSSQLDEVLDGAGEMSVVVGVLAGNCAKAGHKQFEDGADFMRGWAIFVEVGPAAANAARLFAPTTPFEPSKCVYATVPPARWLGKDEPPFSVAPDLREMPKFVMEHAYPTISPWTSQLVDRAAKQGRLLAALMVDMDRLQQQFRYLLKRVHRLAVSDAAIASAFAFTLVDRRDLPPLIMRRLEQTFMNGKYYGPGAPNGEVEDAFGRDFMFVVANLSSSDNWASSLLVDGTYAALGSVDVMRLAPFLNGVAAGTETALVQGDEALQSAGMTALKMNLGGPDPDAPKKKGKGKKGKKDAQEELIETDVEPPADVLAAVEDRMGNGKGTAKPAKKKKKKKRKKDEL